METYSSPPSVRIAGGEPPLAHATKALLADAGCRSFLVLDGTCNIPNQTLNRLRLVHALSRSVAIGGRAGVSAIALKVSTITQGRPLQTSRSQIPRELQSVDRMNDRLQAVLNPFDSLPRFTQVRKGHELLNRLPGA